MKLLALADGHRLHREQAMDALWPDRGPGPAANNLNQAVHAARRALGSEAITLLDGLLRLEAEVDAELFERAASEARRERTARACVRALSLYRGELLPENRYDDWASLERERLADLHAELEQLLSDLGGAREAVRALPAETSTFVGRDHELGELAALLAHTRLLPRTTSTRPCTPRGGRSAPRRSPCTMGLSASMRISMSTRSSAPPATRGASRRAQPANARSPSTAASCCPRTATTTGRASSASACRRCARRSSRCSETSASFPAGVGCRSRRTTFVGREHELAELQALLGRTRLLTLAGVGGVGKTRLALELGAATRTRTPTAGSSSSWTRSTTARLVPSAVAEALDLRALRGGAVIEALAAELEPLELLLVLDNCEHLIGAARPSWTHCSAGAPRLTVLATSREPLRVPGEVVFRVPSLGIPDPDPPSCPRRCSATRPCACSSSAPVPSRRASRSTEAAPAVARICHRLDGLPLALELAAARADALTPAALAGRLDDRFRLLRASSRTAPTRQQTLQAALDWSHELLSPRSRSCCGGSRPSRGASPWRRPRRSAPETASIGRSRAPARAARREVARRRGGAPGPRRYRLLETIRSYAAGRLADAGERAALSARQAAWLAAARGS